MVTIPERLRKPEYRFILINRSEKAPFENEWQKKNNYPYNDLRLLKHLARGGNYGILGGYGDLILVDWDDEELLQKTAHKLPETFTVRSGGGLEHRYYRCRDSNPASFKVTKDNKTLVDIQGERKQLVAPGSTHPNGKKYEVIHDVPIAEIDYAELKAVFEPWLDDKDKPQQVRARQDGLSDKVKQQIKVSDLLRDQGIDTKKNPTGCPFHSSKGGKCLSYDDSKGLWHCFHCEKKGDIFTLYMLTHNCEFKKAVESLARKAGLEKEYEQVKQQKGKKGDGEDIIRTSLLIREDLNLFAEQVYAEGRSLFCVYDMKSGQVTYAADILINGLKYAPHIGEEIEKKAVLLPSQALDYGTDEELDNRILLFIRKWLDIPDDMRRFSLWNTKRSWVYERFHTLNYLRALGDLGQGKTRYLDTLGSIHYKPILTSGATTAAPVFRIIDKWRGTMVFDEGDFKSTEETDLIVKVLNMGYERGKFIMRCDQNDAELIRFFDPYCPKIIATRKTFQDKAVESRCITQVMSGTSRKDILRNLNDDFKREALEIRNMLLMWRFRNYHAIQPNVEGGFDLGDLEPRVEQIVTSFVSLFSKDAKQMELFKEFIKKHQEELIEERQNSFAGSVVLALHSLLEQKNNCISAWDIIVEGQLTDAKGELLKPRALTSTLKSFGFGKNEIKRVGDKTKRCIPLDQNHLNLLFKRYGVTDVTIVTGTSKHQKQLSDEEKNPENRLDRALRNDSNDSNTVTQATPSDTTTTNRNNGNNSNEDFEEEWVYTPPELCRKVVEILNSKVHSYQDLMGVLHAQGYRCCESELSALLAKLSEQGVVFQNPHDVWRAV